jgi:hypothetical protein
VNLPHSSSLQPVGPAAAAHPSWASRNASPVVELPCSPGRIVEKEDSIGSRHIKGRDFQDRKGIDNEDRSGMGASKSVAEVETQDEAKDGK